MHNDRPVPDEVRQTHEKVAESAENDIRAKTLFIGEWVSVCGNCGGNADPDEPSHEMKEMSGKGCGAVWQFVSSDIPGYETLNNRMRPDLEWLPTETIQQVDTRAFEKEELKGLKVVGPFRHEDIVGRDN